MKGKFKLQGVNLVNVEQLTSKAGKPYYMIHISGPVGNNGEVGMMKMASFESTVAQGAMQAVGGVVNVTGNLKFNNYKTQAGEQRTGLNQSITDIQVVSMPQVMQGQPAPQGFAPAQPPIQQPSHPMQPAQQQPQAPQGFTQIQPAAVASSDFDDDIPF